MKAILFNTEKEAKEYDFNNNTLTGDVTKYRFNRRPIKETVILSKAEYAQSMNIPATIMTIDDEEIPNPKYVALNNSYTVNKIALLVGDYFTTYDIDGVATDPENVVTITEEDFYVQEAQ